MVRLTAGDKIEVVGGTHVGAKGVVVKVRKVYVFHAAGGCETGETLRSKRTNVRVVEEENNWMDERNMPEEKDCKDGRRRKHKGMLLELLMDNMEDCGREEKELVGGVVAERLGLKGRRMLG